MGANATRIPTSFSGTDLQAQAHGASPVIAAMSSLQEGQESEQPWSASVVSGQTRPVRSATATSAQTLPEQKIFPGIMHASLRRDSGMDSASGENSNEEENSEQTNGGDHDRYSNGDEQAEGIDWSTVGQVEDDDDFH